MGFREGLSRLFVDKVEKPKTKEEQIIEVEAKIKRLKDGVEVAGRYTPEDGELLASLEKELEVLQSK